MRDPLEDTDIGPTEPAFAQTFFSRTPSEESYSFGAATHVGNVRTRNEDHFAILRMRRSIEVLHTRQELRNVTLPNACAHALVVADGIGGLKSGEIASRMAIQSMLDLAHQATSWVMKLTDLNAQQFEERVDAYVQRIHSTLVEHGRQAMANEKLGTTWTSAHLLGRQAVIVHIGDSRAYLYRSGALIQITRDHTMAQSLVEGGLPPRLAGKFRHVLLNSLGGGDRDPHATVYHFELTAGDRLLLGSDGLSSIVPHRVIAAVLADDLDPQQTCDALIERALVYGGGDNVTVLMAELDHADQST